MITIFNSENPALSSCKFPECIMLKMKHPIYSAFFFLWIGIGTMFNMSGLSAPTITGSFPIYAN
jgi:hypothetical protein